MFSLKIRWAITALLFVLFGIGCDLGTPEDPGRDNPWDKHNPNRPRAPINLRITPYAWNNMHLSWDDRSGNEDGFQLERKVGSDGEWQLLYKTVANFTAYDNSGLLELTTYYYRVNAFNEAGASAYSSEISYTTPHEPPIAPTNLRFVSATTTSITFQWNDNSDDEDGFLIERRFTPTGEWSQISQTNSGTTTFTHRGLSEGTIRYYRIRAFNANAISFYSNELTASTIIDTTILPIADFTWTGSTTTPATISFQNHSQNADQYLWDFGDGRTSTQVAPSVSFSSYGDFNITLMATRSVTSISDSKSRMLTITPGKMYLRIVYVDAILLEGWDLATGPDLFFILSSRTLTVTSPVLLDVTPSDLPVWWIYQSPGVRITDFTNIFTFELYDEDDFDENDLIGTTSFRVNSLVSSHGLVSSYSLENGSIRMRITVRWE